MIDTELDGPDCGMGEAVMFLLTLPLAYARACLRRLVG